MLEDILQKTQLGRTILERSPLSSKRFKDGNKVEQALEKAQEKTYAQLEKPTETRNQAIKKYSLGGLKLLGLETLTASYVAGELLSRGIEAGIRTVKHHYPAVRDYTKERLIKPGIKKVKEGLAHTYKQKKKIGTGAAIGALVASSVIRGPAEIIINMPETKNKVFMYKQNFGSTHLDEEAKAIADYHQPNFLDITDKIIYRASKDYMKRFTENRQELGAKVLPMVGAFKKKDALRLFEHGEAYADSLVDYVQEIGADGICIDIESVLLDTRHTSQLTSFMKTLRERFEQEEKKYEIGIAVSPRFDGSEENGYPHHGFYDYCQLSLQADHIQIMAYDFNVGIARSNISPEELENIVQYAKREVDRNEQIVVLLPLYGRAYTTTGGSFQNNILSARNNHLHLPNATATEYRDGDFVITTATKIFYAQDEKTIRDRLNVLIEENIPNAGGWKQTHGTIEMFEEFKKFRDTTSVTYTSVQ